MNVGVRELKARLSHYLDLAQAGEDVVVTEHGRAVAHLVGLPVELPPQLAEMARRGELIRASAPGIERRTGPRPDRNAGAEPPSRAPVAGSLVDVLLEERQREYDRLP